jgi:putative MFS transporter
MAPPRRSIDDAPFGAFHRRLAAYSCGGPFCDGYILGIIAIALGPLSRDIGLTPGWQGLTAAASLAGMFLGGSLFGYLTDRMGRRMMYTLDLLVFVFASAAQFWVNDHWSLFALRFVLGIAIGADYPIASALMAEFAPKRMRGRLLSAMIGAWWLGYSISFIAGYALSFEGRSAWRWMLASSAVPAAIVSLLRWGTPESARWLVAKGRVAEAQALIRRHFGGDYDLGEVRPYQTEYGRIFRGEYLGRTIFVCLFWSCQIIPTFGIFTFAPDLLQALGSPDPSLGAAILSLCFMVGIVPAVRRADIPRLHRLCGLQCRQQRAPMGVSE